MTRRNQFNRFALCVMTGCLLLGSTAAARATGLAIDLRATAVSGANAFLINNKMVQVSFANTSGSISFDVWAMVTGSDGDNTNESIQRVVSGFTSYQINGGKVLGDNVVGMSTATLKAPFNGPGSSPGSSSVYSSSSPDGSVFPYKYDGDSDLDLGGTSSTSTLNWSIASALGPVTLANPNGAIVLPLSEGFQALLCSVTYSWNHYIPPEFDILGVNKTELNWVGRNSSSIYAFDMDGADGSVTQITRGSPIVITDIIPVPEPTSFMLLAVGALATAAAHQRATSVW